MKKQRELVEALKDRFQEVGNEADAAQMKRYLKDQFEFFGLKAPLRKTVQKQFWREHELPQNTEDLKNLVNLLWDEDYRELHYQAMELLEKPIKKASAGWVPFLEALIQKNAWWDTVDMLASKLMGTYLRNHEKDRNEYPPIWITSEDMWLRRTAILYQLKYKKETDWQRLQDYILLTADETEFFIRKAAGWTLREYSKTNSQAVLDFVEAHQDQLSGLTQREALKWMINKGIIDEK